MQMRCVQEGISGRTTTSETGNGGGVNHGIRNHANRTGHGMTARGKYLVTNCRSRTGEIVYATSHEDAAKQAFADDARRKKPRYSIEVGELSNFLTVYELGGGYEYVPEFTQPVITGVREKP